MVNKLHPKLRLVVIPSDLCVTEELPSINDILKLCTSLHTMRTVCDHFLPCVVGKKHWKMQIQAGKNQWYCHHFWWSICFFDSWEHMGWHDVHKNWGLLLTKKCKKCHNDAESSKVSKNTDSPTKTINEDNKHNTTMVITGQWTKKPWFIVLSLRATVVIWKTHTYPH